MHISKMWRVISIIVLLCTLTLQVSSQETAASRLLHSSVDPQKQQDAVAQLVNRLIGNRSGDFILNVDPKFNGGKESFQIVASDGSVRISGNNGVAVASGFHHYLKHYCNCHISWEASQLQLPEQWPSADVTVIIQQSARYYQNTCTSSYSLVWWSWQDWEKHIDWMALNGVNLPLAFTAQEAIWQRVYTSLGLSQSDIDAYFTGPAFFAWNRMGNVHGWGGPLPSEWHAQRLSLQQRILERMRSLGMIPVLPAFSGFVPEAISRIFPSANVKPMSDWARFNSTYCCTLFLDPLDSLFQRIGSLFMEELISEFGTDHIYNCDSFNENRPPSTDPEYITAVGSSVFKSMTAVDPDAVWMMQGWLFINDQATWKEPQAKALLTSVPIGRMIVLDLQAELNPVYKTTQSFYGQPYIWCMLHNFGGTLGLYGALDMVNEGAFSALSYPNSTLMGIGLAMEGINQNYVMYDFMMEMMLRTERAPLDQWIQDYARRRYGLENEDINQAWKLLQDSVYNSDPDTMRRLHNDHIFSKHHSERESRATVSLIPGNHGQHILVRRPSLKLKPFIWYDEDAVYAARRFLLKPYHKLKALDTYRHDVIDVIRETLQLDFAATYQRLVRAYTLRNSFLTRRLGESLLEVLDKMEQLLSTEKAFRLDTWTGSARQWGTTPEDQHLLEFNARNQITLWGPNGEIVDYAAKQWSGVVGGYYRPRWSLFIERLVSAIENHQRFNQTQFNHDVYAQVEKPFTLEETAGSLSYCEDHVLDNIVRRIKEEALEL